MSEINVISRTQHLIIDPASQAVAVINGAPKGSVPTVGVPVVSGLVHRGTVDVSIPVGAAQQLYLDPTLGLVEKRGSDVEIVNEGANTTKMRVKSDGLYHITAYARASGAVTPGGAVLGIYRNGTIALNRTMFPQASFSAVTLSFATYLIRDDVISMWAYTPVPSLVISTVAQNSLDPSSPRLEIWRVSTVDLIH